MADDLQDLQQMFDLTKKKKKPKKPSTTPLYKTLQQNCEGHYKYDTLLARVYDEMAKNKQTSDRSNIKLNVPMIERAGPKKTIWTNFSVICSQLNRSHEQLRNYMEHEIRTTCNLDMNNRLLIRSRFSGKNVESLLRKYTMTFVLCKSCKSMNTEIKRDTVSKLIFLTCMECNSTVSIVYR